MSADELDAGAGDPTPEAVQAQRKRERDARRLALQRARRAKRKGASTPRPADKAPSDRLAEELGGGDPALEAFVRAELEAPLQSPADLARVLGRIQMSACGLAHGTKWEHPLMALQWTDGTSPTPQCVTGARFLWPFLDRSGLIAKLAQQGDAILAAIGLLILVGPAIRPAIETYRLAAPPPAEQPREEQTAADLRADLHAVEQARA